MKYSLYIVAGIVFIIWGILIHSFNADGPVHILLAVGTFPLFINFFSKEKSN